MYEINYYLVYIPEYMIGKAIEVENMLLSQAKT